MRESVFATYAWVMVDMHKKWDSAGRQDHLLRQHKVNMETYTESTGSRPPEAGLITTDTKREREKPSPTDTCVHVCGRR